MVRDDDVRMQLRVAGSRVVVVERGGDHASHGDARDSVRAHARDRDASLEQVEDIPHRGMMGFDDQRLRARIRDGPERTDRLRRRKGEVEPGDGLPFRNRSRTCRDERLRSGRLRVGGGCFPEVQAGDRISSTAEQQPHCDFTHVVSLGQTSHGVVAEETNARAEPPARGSAGLRVVPRQRRAEQPIHIADRDGSQQVVDSVGRRHLVHRDDHWVPPFRPRGIRMIPSENRCAPAVSNGAGEARAAE